MTPDWHPLQEELKLWLADELALPLWWRDDDTISVTPQLEQLTALSGTLGLPVHLAVIPQGAEAELATYMSAQPALIPVVHGWAHINHAPKGEKKAEFRLDRPIETILADANAGMKRLRELFGEDLCPIFVPPWNRIASEVAIHLPGLGFHILSTATPRKSTLAAPRLEQVNSHLDPIDWRNTRGLVAPEHLIAQTVQLLRDRRVGRADNTEPFGVLTHHLVHDQDIWIFTEELLQRLLKGPGIPWVAAKNRTQKESPNEPT